MFWVKRLKSAEEDTTWSLSFGDLMTLLLAVFVMIAAMSDLKAGAQYERVAGGVRDAFGFKVPNRPAGGLPTTRPMTLAERIEQLARRDAGTAPVDRGGDASMAECELVREGDGLVLRIPAGACFEPFSGMTNPRADRLLSQVAEYLSAGRSQVEVRGYADEGRMPAGTPFRDAWDLSYQRARAATELLTRGGVSRERLCVTAMGSRRGLAGPTDPSAGPTQADGFAGTTPRSPVRGYDLEIAVRTSVAHAE